MAKIKFVSYDGAYPNLCSGKLIVKINGKEVSFSQAKKFCHNLTQEEKHDKR